MSGSTPGYRLDAATVITATEAAAPVAGWLQSALRPATGLPLLQAGEGTGIALNCNPALGHEAYTLEAGPEGVQIRGGDRAGVFYGCQALLQLLPAAIHRRAPVAGQTWQIPGTSISDAPQFSWRGAMLDVARHFLPVREVLRFIDLMALHRLNTLHLHLTDDQGWRMQIRAFERLTSVGAWRTSSQVGAGPHAHQDGRPHGGFYTQEDLREIVAYADQRCVTVVPEIEMPGHVQAALAAYPELGTGADELAVSTQWGISPHVLNMEETTIDFFKTVLDEVMEVFPSTVIGVGGDECPTDQWRDDPRTRQLRDQRHLDTDHELQPWFMARIGAHLAARGRRMYGWDELLAGPVPASTLIASWRGMKGASVAARRGYDVVSCPDTEAYLDYRQSERADEPIPVGPPLTLRRCHAFDPVPAGLSPQEAGHVVGGQANLWAEHMDSARMRDFYAYPRLCAIAEALWTGPGGDFEDFRTRLCEHLRRLDVLGVEYRRETGPLPWQARPDAVGHPMTMQRRLAVVEALVEDLDVP